MSATCGNCKWWVPSAKALGLMGGCTHESVVDPMRDKIGDYANIMMVVRFAPMTCGEHQPKETRDETE